MASPREERTTAASVQPLGEGKKKQRPLLLWLAPGRSPSFRRGFWRCIEGQLATVTTGLRGDLGLQDRLQGRCWSWGQLHGVSRAGGGALLSWGGTQHLVQGVVRPPGTQRGGGSHLLPLFLLPLHQLSEDPWELP